MPVTDRWSAVARPGAAARTKRQRSAPRSARANRRPTATELRSLDKAGRALLLLQRRDADQAVPGCRTDQRVDQGDRQEAGRLVEQEDREEEECGAERARDKNRDVGVGAVSAKVD